MRGGYLPDIVLADVLARRYGMWIFDKRIEEALQNRQQRIVLETIISEIKDTGQPKEFWDVLRNYFDVLGTNLMNIQGKTLKRKISSIFGDDKKRAQGTRRVLGYMKHDGQTIKIMSNF